MPTNDSGNVTLYWTFVRKLISQGISASPLTRTKNMSYPLANRTSMKFLMLLLTTFMPCESRHGTLQLSRTPADIPQGQNWQRTTASARYELIQKTKKTCLRSLSNSSSSLSQCWSRCQKNRLCKGFDFQPGSQLCELVTNSELSASNATSSRQLYLKMPHYGEILKK